MLYNYEEENKDSLACGLSVINGVERKYVDGTCETYLHFVIHYTDVNTGEKCVRGLYLDKEDLLNLSVFVDSCLSGKLTEESCWEMQTKASSYFFLWKDDKKIFWGDDPFFQVCLQITPQQLKEVLAKVRLDH